MATLNQPLSPTTEYGPSSLAGSVKGGMNGKSTVPVPVAPHTRTHSAPFPAYSAMAGATAAFPGPRSPPKKSTQHVPCRFFGSGQCQAGNACQFSHDLDLSQNAVCSYFKKGSCKFGQGCALAHVLPDGRVINRPTRGQFAYARRAPQAMPPGPPSLLSIQAHDLNAQQDLPYYGQRADDPMYSQYNQQQLMGLGPVDMSHPLEPASAFGSPPNDGRMGASPANRGISVLDAPLPNSFDSQGISHAARHGPFASSVPPRFGIESPPSSLPNKPFLGNGNFRGLYDSSFGEAANLDGVLHGAGSSPPTFDEPLSFSKRPLHSERLYSERFARPRMAMSASLGTRPALFGLDHSGSDESDDDGIGEDLLPSSLHELLPQDKLRRFSRDVGEESNNSSFLSAQRRAISTGNTPQDSKVGSLSPLSASPSRYNSLWTSRSYNKQETEYNSPSAFGHVGSPLRPSALRSSSLANVAASASADTSPYAVGSPPKQASMSMLTQELQRSKLGEHSKPPGASSRTALSNGAHPSRSSLIERGLSSNSLGRETIEEEQGLFSMEEEDGEAGASAEFPSSKGGASSSNNKSAKNPVFELTPGKSQTTLGAIGTK